MGGGRIKGVEGWEGVELEEENSPPSHLLSLVHKITNVPVVYMGLDVWIWMGRNPFLGVYFSTFLGPNGTRYACCQFRAQKSLDFRAHLFKRPSL
jgi:hypothetical protein